MILQPELIDRYHEELKTALEERRYSEAASIATAKLSDSRAAEVLSEASAEAAIPFLLACGGAHGGRILAKLPTGYAAQALCSAAPETAGALLEMTPPDHAADIIQALPDDTRGQLLQHTSSVFNETIGTLRRYAPGTAGAHMTSRFLTITRDHSVGETLSAIRSAAADIEHSSYVYVVDGIGKPLGVVSARDLLRHDPKAPLLRAMTPHVVAVTVDDSAAEAARLIRNRRFTMLPVLDHNSVLVGVISFDDAIDILTTQVADQFTGINAGSTDESFFTPPLSAIKMRLPWMAANVFLNLGAVAVITGFEETIAAVAILAAFLPMITDMGGNVGIQSLSVAIRAIALGEVRLREFWRAIRKELVIGLINGVALGMLFMTIATVWHRNALIGAIAGFALSINVVVAGVVGGTIPFLIKRLGKDPALMTGPLLTTITDITGVSIYLGLSTLLLLR